MRKTSPLNYAFAIGKIRALEKLLIKQEVFQEAIESGLDETLRLFVESDLYSEELLHIKNSQQLEDVLNKELIKVKNIIEELILDKELLDLLKIDNLRQVKEIIKQFPGQFLSDYINYLVDMHNIKTFLRIYFLKGKIEELEEKINCEGFLKKKDFLKLFDKELHLFLHRLEYVYNREKPINYAGYLSDAIINLEKNNSFVVLEKAINDFLIDIIKPAKYLSFGPEPVLAYYFAKVNEINLIRMIILAKLNNVESGLVKERFNSVYA